ncbi:MAG: ribonuclease R [Clostridia bacterium]|nr:ribonuclease R [Clostridia bacterium]
MDYIEQIKSFIEQTDYVPMTRAELIEALSPEDKDAFKDALASLEQSGVVLKNKNRKFVCAAAEGYLKAAYQGTGKGYGFARVEGENDDLFIPPDSVGGALDGDEALVKITAPGKDGKSGEACVVKILKRAHETLVGTYHQKNFYGVIKADNSKIGCEFLVDEEDAHGALDGQKVVFKITRYPTHDKSAVAEIKEILGFPTDVGVDVLSVIKNYGFETEFPPEVIREANELPNEVTDTADRLDLTDKIIFTIDGADTKDIDDAVSVEKNGDLWRLGVHIADVSHYVTPRSALDNEAMARGTSVYLADRVIPMLPPKLSNGICSLNEGVLRYAVSVFMDVDEHGEVKSHTIANSVIRSAAKMTYDNVYLLMTGEADEESKTKYARLLPSIKDMTELFNILKRASHERGNVDFEAPEAKIIMNDAGEVEDILLRERSDAHMMIEEFMVIANSTVARHIASRNLPAIYRTHDAPDGEKLESFRNFVYTLGYNPPEGQLTPKKLQAFLESIEDEKMRQIISSVALRSMQKAKYLPENTGHYGLSLAYYTHFTSPIRRYPDLLFHRALKASMSHDKKMLDYVKSVNKKASEVSSERELAAEHAERDVADIKKAQYMSRFIGESFEGVISSVTRFGFFIMLPNTVEGLVRTENLAGDKYEFDEKRLIITGSEHTYRLGDAISVTLVAANPELGQIDFIPEGMEYGKKNGKTDSAKQESVPRVFHRRKNRGGNRAVRNRGKKRSSRKGKS